MYVDLPSPGERGEIMRTLVRGVRIGQSAELRSTSASIAPQTASPSTQSLAIAEPQATPADPERDNIVALIAQFAIDKCDGYSGADLAALVREAAVGALRSVLLSNSSPEKGEGGIVVTLADFVRALSKMGPSVSAVQRRRYEALRVKFAGGRGGGDLRVRNDDGRAGELGVGEVEGEKDLKEGGNGAGSGAPMEG